MKRQLAALMAELTTDEPLVLVLEDVHWGDASTADLIAYLGDRFDTLPMLLIITYRPSELLLAQHPLIEGLRTLKARGSVRETHLQPFSRQGLADYVGAAYPRHLLPDELLALVHARTQGTPLFVVDLLRHLAHRKVIAQRDDVWHLEESLDAVASELPESVRSVIQRTIDRLDEADRRLLVTASVQGAEFDSAVISRAIPMETEEAEERLEHLERVHGMVSLVDERILGRRVPSLRYSFTHILYQNTLHATLRGSRRLTLSAAVADAIQDVYGDDPSQAAQLGALNTAARRFDRAAQSYLLAARAAARLFANQEAVLVARRGLEALAFVPESDERAALELHLQLAVGVPLTELLGYAAPEVEAAYSRARELTARLAKPAAQIPVLLGLYRFYAAAAKLQQAREVVERMMDVANASGDSNHIFYAHSAMGAPLLHLGLFEEAVEHLEAATHAYDPDKHADRALYSTFAPGGWLALAYWLLGEPEKALEANRVARQIAERERSPFAIAYVESLTAWLHQYRGDAEAVKRHAEAAVEVARAHDFRLWLAVGAMFRAWAVVALGDPEQGLPQLKGTIEKYRRTGAELNLPHFLGILADAYRCAKDAGAGLDVIDEALAIAAKNQDRCWEPELLRLKGELLLVAHGATGAFVTDAMRVDARTHFERAIELAAQQRSRSLQLRAALSLARILAAGGDRDDGRRVVADALGSLPAGLRTPDVDEARLLIEAPV